MKKKMVILLLTLGILGMAAGCGDKKADTDKKEETAGLEMRYGTKEQKTI